MKEDVEMIEVEEKLEVILVVWVKVGAGEIKINLKVVDHKEWNLKINLENLNLIEKIKSLKKNGKMKNLLKYYEFQIPQVN